MSIKKPYPLYANGRPTKIAFDTLVEAEAYLEAAMEREGPDWRVGWWYRTREGRKNMSVRNPDGTEMNYVAPRKHSKE
jgi:hypothetical protein